MTVSRRLMLSGSGALLGTGLIGTCAKAAPAHPTHKCASYTAQPIPPIYAGPHYDGIIDVLDGNGFDFGQMASVDVSAIFHLTSRGTYHPDMAYERHKAAAIKAGYLWGAFHLLSMEPVDHQLKFLLSKEPLTDPNVAIAVDWEEGVGCGGGPANYAQLKAFVTLLRNHLEVLTPGRWPILYAGPYLRDPAIMPQHDGFLASCPLWYNRYRGDYPYQVPSIFPKVALWQFDDENRCYGSPPKNILPGADFNRFYGSKAELAERWPFNQA